MIGAGPLGRALAHKSIDLGIDTRAVSARPSLADNVDLGLADKIDLAFCSHYR
jgi:hypothetical protein